MSGFDNAMQVLCPVQEKEVYRNIGTYDVANNVLTVYTDVVEITFDIPYVDSIKSFTIMRAPQLEDDNIIPKVTIRKIERGRQPVIGPKTNDNLSYGRYEFARGSMNELIVDGCDVTLVSDIEAFTIGVYGSEVVPSIILKNDGKLNCPETTGKRVMQIGPEPLQGSTKHSRSCKYVIWKKDSKEEDFLSDEVLSLRDELEILSPAMAKFVGMRTLPNRLESAIKLVGMKEDLDVSRLLIEEYLWQGKAILIGCIVLGLSDECFNSHGEIYYEINRWEELAKKYDIPYDANNPDMFDTVSEIVIRKMFEGKTFKQLSNWEKKIVYELIPVYSLNFTGKSEDECSEEWWNKVMSMG